MARSLRLCGAGFTYHVTSRGNARMAIFLDDLDRVSFLENLAEVVRQRRLACVAYCLMNNHYHLVVKTQEPNLPVALRDVNGNYGQRWNGRHGRTGHVFQGRYWAQLIEDESYLLTACRYVVLNPVRAGLAATPADWRWSSYRATAGLCAAPALLDLSCLWDCLGGADGDTPTAHYRRFVGDAEDARPLPRRPVLGTDDFVARFADRRARAGRAHPRRERRELPALERLFANASTRTAIGAAVVEAHRSGYRMAEIARFLDIHPSTVSKMLGRDAGDGALARDSRL